MQEVEQRTTPWMEEVEPRREQRSRSNYRDAQVLQVHDEQERPIIPLHSRHPWRSDGGGSTHAQL